MRIEIADRAVHLSQDGDARDTGALRVQARGDVGEFLAHRGGGRGLAVGARQHRRRGVPVRQRVEHFADGVEHGQKLRRARALQHECVGEVVDVFRCAREMQPFEFGRGRTLRVEFAAQPNFHRLHVVIGARLDVLDGRGIGAGGVFRQRREQIAGRARQLRQSVRGRP